MSGVVAFKIPVNGVPRKLHSEVAKILEKLAPLVASEIGQRKQEQMRSLVTVLTQGVSLKEVDLRQARTQAASLRAILQNAEWLTATEIGKLGKFSRSNLAAPANRWKNEKKLFAIEHQGQARFPRYALDETFRPLPVMASVLIALGAISAWRMAAWFESTNAWLGNKRPRELIAFAPERTLQAALAYASGGHG